jgi:hypothetical protein
MLKTALFCLLASCVDSGEPLPEEPEAMIPSPPLLLAPRAMRTVDKKTREVIFVMSYEAYDNLQRQISDVQSWAREYIDPRYPQAPENPN